MPLVPLACAKCGAPIKVPEGVSFVTCSYCESSLEVRSEGGAHYSVLRELADIKANTERAAQASERMAANSEQALSATKSLQHSQLRTELTDLEERMVKNGRLLANAQEGVKSAKLRHPLIGCKAIFTAGLLIFLLFAMLPAALMVPSTPSSEVSVIPALAMLFGFFVVFPAVCYSVFLGRLRLIVNKDLAHFSENANELSKLQATMAARKKEILAALNGDK